MPELNEDFKSPFIKAGVDVRDGDNLRFLDAGTREADKKRIGEYNWIFSVGVVRDGELIRTKKFQLNKLNFKVVSKAYGTDSDNYEGKEMRVNIVKRQNPQSGEVVDSIALSAPGIPGEVEIEDL